jgi:uncharacterized phage protein gp47/JayE
MASQIQIQSFNQFLGAMLRTIIANTPLNDVNQGSVLLTILEAAAANDFENNSAILSLLNLLNISTVSGTDLDNRAADYGLTRLSAVKASGNITIFNTSIVKQSASLYIIKPAPIAGQNTLYVNNTVGWAASGTLYVGRGTNSFEGPVPYSSIVVFPTFSQINLSASLQNNHLISDTVINAQGQPDRIIAAGTVVKIPANNQNPEIDYSTLRDAILPAGETEVDNVSALAQVAGTIGNAPINTITQFDTSPFTGAAVSNTSAFSGGTDVETDQELRDRITDYPNTLARGTEAAILAAVINVSDPDDNNQVASAIIQEPAALDEPAILYIDNGSGFQPSYVGQSVDTLLTNATGKEEFLQTANYPITRPQVVNTGIGPFNLTTGSFLTVAVDGVSEVITFVTSDFVNISSAQVAEIVVAINNQATLFSARLTNNSANILIYPDAFDAERIQVLPLQPADDSALYVNTLLQFPVTEFSFIALFQNSTRLREKTITAQLQTVGFGSWGITSSGDLSISVDGTPEQDRTFNLSNFPGISSFASLTLDDWVTAFNQQFAGITATATANQTMQLNSNQSGINSSLLIVGGSLLKNLFPTQPTSSTGQTGQFILNRQTGNLQILTVINPGDDITAGIVDAKGFVISATSVTGVYNLSTDAFGRPAEMVIVADSTYCNTGTVAAAVGSTLTISNPSGDVMRIMSNTIATFADLLPGDFIFFPVCTTSWLSTGNTGLFKIVDKGGHTTAGTDTYIEVLNPAANIVAQTVSVADPADVQAFSTDGYPQLWIPARAGTSIPNPVVATLDDIVTSLNTDIINVIASTYHTDAIKLTSTTEQGGSIAIPVVVGNAISVFTATTVAQFGNPSEIASIVSSKSLLTHFKISQPTNKDTFLSRQVFDDSKGALTLDAIPAAPPYTTAYSEVIQSTGELNTTFVDYDSIINFTRGNNKDQLRSIAAFNPVSYPTDTVGTQEALARTSLDHTVGDEFEIVKGLQLSATDTVVVIVDENPQQNTINIPMFRTGQVNSGSNLMSFIPTTTEFSANDYDYDNAPPPVGIDFSNANVWSTTLNATNFSDYAAWFRARNWYISGGVGSGLGAMIVRADEYGPNGDFLRFSMQYPTIPNQLATTSFDNTPSFTTFSYFFGSGPARVTGLISGDTISVDGPYSTTIIDFPNGIPTGGNYWDYTFPAGALAAGGVALGDVISIGNNSGVSVSNQGTFSVQNILGDTVRVYNPSGVVTPPGSPAIYTITTVDDVDGSLNSTYFTVQDTAGSVAIWINENGTGIQPAIGANRYIPVNATSVSSSLLATAANYAVLGASTVTNAGFTVITGNLGLFPGTSVTGFPPGIVTGTQDIANAAAHQAQTDANAAYVTLAAHAGYVNLGYNALDGQTVTGGGYYTFPSGNVHLAQSGNGTFTISGSATDIFVFKTPSTLITGASGTPTITLIGGVLAANVYWVVGSSATLNQSTTGVFEGTIIALTSAQVGGGSVNGRLIALNAAVNINAATAIMTPAESTGITAATIAADIVTAITGDAALTASAIGPVVTITNILDGLLPGATAGTSGFTVAPLTPTGTNPVPEVITNPVGINIFPLTGTTTASISTTINNSTLMNATPVGLSSLTITKATQEESSATVGFGYTPGNSYVAMYDGANWVKTFENINPNFIFKTAFVLQGAQPTIYSMDTAPNFDVATNGELFKLIPITVQNLYHQFTQKALSQLPIIATVNITDDRKNVQIKSNNLGSAGAVEVAGGAGNQSKAYIEVESEVDIDGSGSYLVFKIPAYPDTFSVGDTVLLQNDSGVERFNRLSSTDTMGVLNTGPGVFEYTYDAKTTGINSGTTFIIVDVSASYSLPLGFVWRWTATGGSVDLINVNPGDLLNAFGLGAGWNQNNQVHPSGDAQVSGFPIVNVNIASNYIDAVNPFGVAMSSTAVGSGFVQITPTPAIKWYLQNANYTPIVSLISNGTVVTVVTSGANYLNTGDSVTIRDSYNVPDNAYTPITVTGPNTFTFAYVAAAFTETSTFASVIATPLALTATRYRMQSLGFNGLVRLSASNGQSPNFLSCGVAVDDYLLISGTTFNSNNNGRFRVLAVDNNSIIFINKAETDQLNTTITMNNQNLEAVWVSNTNSVTGVAGTFKYVTIGSWVKKQSDPDSDYLQVLSLNDTLGNATTAALAVSITLGGNYAGSDNTAMGTVYNETTGYDQGVYLQDSSDIQVFEGDSVVEGDTLYVQNIVNTSWFNVNNVGSFTVVEYGTEPTTYLPFIRVKNPSGVIQSNVQMSVNPAGVYIIEGFANKFYSIREVTYAVLDDAVSTLRDIYITPYSRSYKFTPANNSSITHLGKVGYSNVVAIGTDGYTYYTGLLQKVQRIVDGFEPDAADYPGQRAVGAAVETLPPLPYQVNLALNVATNAGVNIGDVSNNIKSTIINYVEGLGVGAPMILSQIIANVQAVKGVASVVFTNPVPSTPSITISSNEKFIINASNISIA